MQAFIEQNFERSVPETKNNSCRGTESQQQSFIGKHSVSVIKIFNKLKKPFIESFNVVFGQSDFCGNVIFGKYFPRVEHRKNRRVSRTHATEKQDLKNILCFFLAIHLH